MKVFHVCVGGRGLLELGLVAHKMLMLHMGNCF